MSIWEIIALAVLYYAACVVVLYFTVFKKIEADLVYDYEHDETDYKPGKYDAFLMSLGWPLLFVLASRLKWKQRKEPKE